MRASDLEHAVGQKMTEFEAVNIATAFASRHLSGPPEFAGALRDPMESNEWVVHFNSTPAGRPLMDPSTFIVIVDMDTRQARWFVVL
jgi:hypothetical protein